MDAVKIEQDIKDIKEALCIIRHYGACDLQADGVVEAGKRLIEIVDKWERRKQMQIVIKIDDKLYNRIKYLEPRADTMLNELMRSVHNGTPLPNDVEILTAEAYSELCLMASALNDTKSEVKVLKKRQWDAMEANVKNENYNPYLAEYLKGYICALSMVEGATAESEAESEGKE